MTNWRCYLCGSNSSFSPVWEDSEKGFFVLRCCRCRLVFQPEFEKAFEDFQGDVVSYYERNMHGEGGTPRHWCVGVALK